MVSTSQAFVPRRQRIRHGGAALYRDPLSWPDCSTATSAERRRFSARSVRNARRSLAEQQRTGPDDHDEQARLRVSQLTETVELLRTLRSDPSLRFTDGGRAFLQLLGVSVLWEQNPERLIDNLPPHWRTPHHTPEYEARSWALGQLATARASLELLNDRTSRQDAVWPEFAAAGKGGATVRHALCHRAGVPAVHELLTNDDLWSWERMTAACDTLATGLPPAGSELQMVLVIAWGWAALHPDLDYFSRGRPNPASRLRSRANEKMINARPAISRTMNGKRGRDETTMVRTALAKTRARPTPPMATSILRRRIAASSAARRRSRGVGRLDSTVPHPASR